MNYKLLLYILITSASLFAGCRKKVKNQHPESFLFLETFEDDYCGPYTTNNIQSDFNNPKFLWGYLDRVKYYLGFIGNNLEIIKDSSNCLRIKIPQNTFGPVPGLQWATSLNGSYKEVTLTYDFKFDKNFDFVKGGKLPGLAGGKANTGGKKPNGYDGWSARMMFWENGKICCWLYHVNQPNKFGDSLFLKEDGKYFTLKTDKWYELKTYLKINHIDSSNGILECYLDNNLLMRKDNLVFTKTNNLKIDQFIFSIFLGGDNPSYKSFKDEYIYIDNIKIRDR